MNKSDLVSLRDKLSEYKRQFEDNYNPQIGGPYGSNSEKRSASKSKYESAISLTIRWIKLTNIYNFLKDRASAIPEIYWINEYTDFRRFIYDLRKLLDAIDGEIQLLD